MINKTLRFILGLTFLPERARRWMKRCARMRAHDTTGFR